MHIFAYRWNGALDADSLAKLKEAIADRTLVLFQNMPAAMKDHFPGGTYTASAANAGVGCYVYSAEAEVMDRSDWRIDPIDGDMNGQIIHIFGNTVVNFDMTAELTGGDTTALQTFATSSDNNCAACIGHNEKTFDIEGFTKTVKDGSTVTDITVESGTAMCYLKDSWTLTSNTLFDYPMNHSTSTNPYHKSANFEITE